MCVLHLLYFYKPTVTLPSTMSGCGGRSEVTGFKLLRKGRAEEVNELQLIEFGNVCVQSGPNDPLPAFLFDTVLPGRLSRRLVDVHTKL